MTQPFGFIRRLHSIPMKRLACYAGVSVGLICDAENCRRPISKRLMNRIHEALKIAIIENMDKDGLFIQDSNVKKDEFVHT